MMRTAPTALLIAAALGLAGAAARAGDVAVASAAAVRAPLLAAAALSEAATGDRLALSFGTAGAVAERAAGAEPIDVVVLPPARLDELQRRGLVREAGRAPLGTVRLGAAVRAGAARPALATEADLRAALAAAPSIGLADPAAGATTGVYFARLLGELGLAEALKPRIRLYPDGTGAAEALARGEVALMMGQISEIRPVAGIDLAGPLPDAAQLRTVYAAGVSARSTHPEAAEAAIAFLRSGQVAPAFRDAGFDPP